MNLPRWMFQHAGEGKRTSASEAAAKVRGGVGDSQVENEALRRFLSGLVSLNS